MLLHFHISHSKQPTLTLLTLSLLYAAARCCTHLRTIIAAIATLLVLVVMISVVLVLTFHPRLRSPEPWVEDLRQACHDSSDNSTEHVIALASHLKPAKHLSHPNEEEFGVSREFEFETNGTYDEDEDPWGRSGPRSLYPDHQRHHVMDTKNVQSEIIEQWTNQILKEENKNAAKKTYVLGSRAPVHFDDNIGFFATIMAAYNNHWALRTSPDDWWMTIRKFEMFK